MSPRPLSTIMNPSPIGKKTPSPQDVILGRGGHSNHHQGNAVFRSVVSRAKSVYNDAPKPQKIVVARSIVEAVYSRGSPPGRFLSKNSKDGLWYEVPFQKAVEKTKQALREKTWKKEEDNEEDEEAERVGKSILDLPALEARVSVGSPKKLSSLLSSSESNVGKLVGKKRRAPSSPSTSKPTGLSARAATAPATAACAKPHCSDPSLPLPPSCIRRSSVATNTAPKQTVAAAQKEGPAGAHEVAFNKFFAKIGPIPTTLARLTTALIEGTVEKPSGPPEKKRKVMRSIEEDGHKRTMKKWFQKPMPKSPPPLKKVARRSVTAPSPTTTTAMSVAVMPLETQAIMMAKPHHRTAPLQREPEAPSESPNRPGVLQHASKSIPAYRNSGIGNAPLSPITPLTVAAAATTPSPSATEQVPAFCNPFDEDEDETPDWQKAWKSGGTPSPSASLGSVAVQPNAADTAAPAAPASPPLRSDTTSFFSSLFFGRGGPQSNDESEQGEGGSLKSASSGGGSSVSSVQSDLTSLIRKASDTMMTALGRGLSPNGGGGGASSSLPTAQALTGGISRGLSLGLGRGLTMAMGFRGDDANLPHAGPPGSFDWGDNEGKAAGPVPKQPQEERQGAQHPAGQAARRRMSLIDDDEEEEERPELARLRSLETRPSPLAHRSLSAPHHSMHR